MDEYSMANFRMGVGVTSMGPTKKGLPETPAAPKKKS